MRIRYTEITGTNKKIVKKEPEKRLRKGRVALVISFIVFLIIDVLLIFEYKVYGVDAIGYKIMTEVNNVIDSGSDFVSSIWEPELEHDNNLTSILVVGIDSRYVEFNGEEFVDKRPDGKEGSRNSDTIMQIVYDHADGDVFMISIPRDMGVDVEKECLEFHGSIHWVYDKGQSANCPGGGVQTLKEVVEGVTGIKVQYHAFITLDLFTNIIDAVGEKNESGERGIWLDVPETLYEIYPLGDKGWENVYFPEGRQFMTGEDALKYARSRQLTSDFSRARRQQEVISAVKDRVLSSSTLTNPKKLYSLINAFKKDTIFTSPSLEEIRAGLSIARDINDSEIYSVVLDPSLGGKEALLNKQPHDRNTAQYYMVPTQWRECPENVFCRVQEYIQKIISHPDVYEEKATVYVYARDHKEDWTLNFDNANYQAFKNNGLPIILNESQYKANVDSEADIIIIDYSEGEKSATFESIKNALNAEVLTPAELPGLNINDEDITIVVKGI